MNQPRGKLKQTIAQAFAAEPDNAFTTADLCMKAYSCELNEVSRPQRVAMQRAMKAMEKSNAHLVLWNGEGAKGQLIILDHSSVDSYAMARLKDDYLNRYQCGGRSLSGKASEEEKLRLRREDSRYNDLTKPGGAWYRYVEQFNLRLAGNNEAADRMAREDEERLARDFGQIQLGHIHDTKEAVLSDLRSVLCRLEKVSDQDEYRFDTGNEVEASWIICRVVAPEKKCI
jgi:hypothetical protein